MPFVQYEQILLDKNFRQHLETILVSEKILRMGAQKRPIQKTYEIQKGSDSLSVEFLGANRQFDWIEISIVPDKNKGIDNILSIFKFGVSKIKNKHSKCTVF